MRSTYYSLPKQRKPARHPCRPPVQGVKEEEWIHLSSGAMAQTFPITIEHLFARLCQPELESLIHQGDFEAHLQPILNMKDSSIFGYEALLRTKGRQVNPGELFDYAARSGLQSMLDQKARRAAVQAKAEHLQRGSTSSSISFHLLFMYRNFV